MVDQFDIDGRDLILPILVYAPKFSEIYTSKTNLCAGSLVKSELTLTELTEYAGCIKPGFL